MIEKNHINKFLFICIVIILLIANGYGGQRGIYSKNATNLSYYNHPLLRNSYINKSSDATTAIASKRDSNTTLIGRWSYGPCYTVAQKEDIAYFGNGCYMQIVDCSNPLNLIKLGEILTPSVIMSIAIKGDYAYVASFDEGLIVVDISVPSNPVEVGRLSEGGFVACVDVKGDYAYVACRDRGLRIIDISSPENPVGISTIDTGGRADGVAVNDSLACVADKTGLRIIDITNPTEPLEIGFFETRYPMDVTLSGTYAYVAGKSKGLFVLDITTPENPVKVGSLDTGGLCADIAIDGNYAYVAQGSMGLRIVDVSTPSNPLEVASACDVSWGVVVIDSFVYVADSNCMQIVNIAEPSTPIEKDSFDTYDGAMGVAANDRYVFVAAGKKGLRVLDMSVASNPVEIGFLDMGDFANNVSVAGNYAFVVYGLDGRNGLGVIDISTPSNPVEVDFVTTGNIAWDVALKDNLAIMTSWSSGLQIFNFSNPTDLLSIGRYRCSEPEGLAVRGNYAYVTHGSDGLFVIDISTPSLPDRVGVFNTSEYAYAADVTVNGNNYVYVAYMLPSCLRVIDVSNPSIPVEATILDNDTMLYGVAANDNFVYLANEVQGLRVIDVSNPTEPKEVGFYNTGDVANKVAVNGNYVYVADYDAGIYIIRNDLQTGISQEDEKIGLETFTLNQNFPNPFNPTTTIQYEVPYPSEISLVIYDVLGREVKTLLNRTSQPGSFETTWDGKDDFNNPVAGGIYFCRMEAGEFVRTIKLVFVR